MPPWQLETTWGSNGNNNRFDNVLMSLWVLFQIATMENWAPIMFQAMNITGVDTQPVYGASNAIALYFIAFIVVCSFFILNLVIGVAIMQV